jgi:hypothetical protein
LPHPSVEDVLRYFEFDHLPAKLAEISSGFHDLAHALVKDQDTDGPQLTIALHKLLESKDAAVRSAIPRMDEIPEDVNPVCQCGHLQSRHVPVTSGRMRCVEMNCHCGKFTPWE